MKIRKAAETLERKRRGDKAAQLHDLCLEPSL